MLGSDNRFRAGVGRGRAFALGAGALLLTSVAALVPAAAQAATPNNIGPNVAVAAHAQLRAGTLLQTHGVQSVCGAVKGVTGHCLAQRVTAARGSAKPLATSTPVGYGPAELAAAFHLPSANVGNTGTIAIIDAGAYPILESDVNAYRAQYGLPACTVASGCLTIENYQGGPALTPDPTPLGQAEEENVAVETSLDMDMASAACPGCKLIELQIPLIDGFASDQTQIDQALDDFGTAVGTAADQGANAVSMSYQYPSDKNGETGPAGRALFRPGVAVLASSGDGGFEGNQHTGWPQNLPWVTSVGGTSVYPANAAGTAFSQVAWSGSGSGCETDLPAAIGQPPAVAAYCGGHRADADVSADADPNTGPAIYDTYAPFSGQPANWQVVGGTSASSPYLAGLYARGGHTTQVIGPNTLYTAPKGAFTNVTVGTNAPPHACASQGAPVQLCQAGAGWNGPTGIGVPNGLAGF